MSNSPPIIGKEEGEWRKEFREKVNEVRRIIPQEGVEPEIVEFGSKGLGRDLDGSKMMYTIPDWGNIEKFIEKVINKYGA